MQVRSSRIRQQIQEQFQFIRQHPMYSATASMQPTDSDLQMQVTSMEDLQIQLRMFLRREQQLLKVVVQHLHLHQEQLQSHIQLKLLLQTVVTSQHRRQSMVEATTSLHIHFLSTESRQHLQMHITLQRLRVLSRTTQELSTQRHLEILTVIFLILTLSQRSHISTVFLLQLITHSEHLILSDLSSMVQISLFIQLQSSSADTEQLSVASLLSPESLTGRQAESIQTSLLQTQAIMEYHSMMLQDQLLSLHTSVLSSFVIQVQQFLHSTHFSFFREQRLCPFVLRDMLRIQLRLLNSLRIIHRLRRLIILQSRIIRIMSFTRSTSRTAAALSLHLRSRAARKRPMHSSMA